MTCDKISFDRIEDARRVADKVQSERNCKVRVYTCDKCGSIHIASKGKPKKQMNARTRHVKEEYEVNASYMKEGKIKIKAAKEKGNVFIRSFCVSNQNT